MYQKFCLQESRSEDGYFEPGDFPVQTVVVVIGDFVNFGRVTLLVTHNYNLKSTKITSVNDISGGRGIQ